MAGAGGAALGLCITPQCTVIPAGVTGGTAEVALLPARLFFEHPPDLPMAPECQRHLLSSCPHWSRGEFSPLPRAGIAPQVGDGVPDHTKTPVAKGWI